jgi:hypothetical protein
MFLKTYTSLEPHAYCNYFGTLAHVCLIVSISVKACRKGILYVNMCFIFHLQLSLETFFSPINAVSARRSHVDIRVHFWPIWTKILNVFDKFHERPFRNLLGFGRNRLTDRLREENVCSFAMFRSQRAKNLDNRHGSVSHLLLHSQGPFWNISYFSVKLVVITFQERCPDGRTVAL